MQDWYLKRRRAVEEEFAAAVALADEACTVSSPSGAYSLSIVPCEVDDERGCFTRGVAFDVGRRSVVAEIQRNFSHFPWSWAEGHPAGHSYLVCGEDYQGQTVIELDTGRRRDHIPADADRADVFCWTDHHPSPDGRLLAVEGCFWGSPDELVIYDFRSPLELPYAELARFPLWEAVGFADDGSFVFEYRVLIRSSDRKPTDEMSDEELEEFEADENFSELSEERTVRMCWHPERGERVLSYRNDPPSMRWPAGL